MTLPTIAKVAFIAVLLIHLVVSILFGMTSIKKGYYGIYTGRMTMFLGFAGMLYVIALPKKQPEADDSKRQTTFIVAMLIGFAVQTLGGVVLFKYFFNSMENMHIGITEKAIET